jgi:hypothetical protein
MSRYRRTLALSLSTTLLLLAVLAVPVRAGGAQFAFQVTLNDQCFLLTGPPETSATVSLRTAGGNLRDRLRTSTDIKGFAFDCFRVSIRGGNVIKALADGNATVWSIPKLTIGTDRDTDVTSGHGPANRSLQLLLVHFNTFDGPSSFHDREVVTDADGDYSTDFSNDVNVKGADEAVAYLSEGDHRVAAVGIVPFMRIVRNDNVVFGALNLGDSISLALRRSDGSLKAEAQVGPVPFLNIYDVALYDSDGDAVAARAGDVLNGSFADDAEITLPVMVLTGSAASDEVRGRCMPNRPYRVFIERFDFEGGDFVFQEFTGRTGSDGTFTEDVSGRVNLKVGDKLELTCRYPSGDQVGRFSSATS